MLYDEHGRRILREDRVLCCTLASVSYTHLDVYKRQSLRAAASQRLSAKAIFTAEFGYSVCSANPMRTA